MRQTIGRLFGVTTRRPFPPFALERFDHWFAKRPPFRAAYRGRVMLWDDTFVRYYEPHVGQAAIKVLEAAGFEVVLPTHRKCCGRPAFSQGNLDEVARLGRHNIALLNQERGNTPIIFLEPSCYSMFVQDYRELKLPDLDRVAARCFLFEQFVENLLDREPHALTFNDLPARMMIYVHCHAKSLANTDYMYQLATRMQRRGDGGESEQGQNNAAAGRSLRHCLDEVTELRRQILRTADGDGAEIERARFVVRGFKHIAERFEV